MSLLKSTQFPFIVAIKECALAQSGKGIARWHHFIYQFQCRQHRWPLPWVHVNQTWQCHSVYPCLSHCGTRRQINIMSSSFVSINPTLSDLYWHWHMVSDVTVLISVPRTMFTHIQKPNFMLIVKTTPLSNRASQPLTTELNCICNNAL